MFVSIDWIKDYVDLPDILPEEMMTRFTMATAEVEEISRTGAHLQKITVSEVVDIEKHPEADRLKLVTFKVDEKNTKKVVCGALNVTVGMKVPYAPLGTTFPGGFTLVPKKIRGIMSEGMLCSEQELGFAQNLDGLMSLKKDAPVGKTMMEYLNLKEDILLDIDNKSLTHRPDLWGMYGMAREFASVYDCELKNPFSGKWMEKFKKMYTKDKSPVVPVIDGECSCLGYYGLSVENIKVGESPDWMKRRLLALGHRSINNIVDISNYVMLELGIPLHIFDRDLIKGDRLIIKRAEKEEKFVTLDEIERNLVPSDTVIGDDKETLVLAGIMGGLSSGVTENTRNIFIEVANWKAADVRKTSGRLGLRTDSSQRYEKCLDTALLERTMFRTLELVLKLCPDAKVVGKLEYDGIKWWNEKTKLIETSVLKINTVLGTQVSREKIERIFTSLDFKVEKIDGGSIDTMNVEVPTFRATKDVECESDLIEEIGRIIGYDNIQEVSPALDIKPVRLSEAQKLHRDIRDFLVYKGNAFEVMTYPMIGQKLLEKANWSEDAIRIINYLSEDHAIMRTSMVPGILEAASKNQKNYDAFKFFELGRTYHKDKTCFFSERNHLAIVFGSGSENPFMDLVNTVEKLLKSISLPFDLCEQMKIKSNIFLDEKWIGCHPYEYLNIRIMGKMHGAITSVHPLLLGNFKIKCNLAIAIIDLSSFENKKIKDQTKYKALPKYPGSTFDWTVLANNDSHVEEIFKALKKVKIKQMVKCEVVSIFKLNELQKTVTLRATFSDPEGTLDGGFLDRSKNQLVEILGKSGFPLKMQ